MPVLPGGVNVYYSVSEINKEIVGTMGGYDTIMIAVGSLDFQPIPYE
jgi:hypothetical protein